MCSPSEPVNRNEGLQERVKGSRKIKGTSAGAVPNRGLHVGCLCASRITVCAGDSAKGADFREFYMRSEEHTSELQSIMRISYAVFCLTTDNTPKKGKAHN